MNRTRVGLLVWGFAIMAAAGIPAGDAHAVETVIATGTMPPNCERGADGVITCSGMTMEDFCDAHGSESQYEQFCFGDGSSGGGRSGSGGASGGGSGSGSDSGGSGTSCRENEVFHRGSCIRAPDCPAGYPQWNSVAEHWECTIEMTPGLACAMIAGTVVGGVGGWVCAVSVPATWGTTSAIVCGAAFGAATSTATYALEVCD